MFTKKWKTNQRRNGFIKTKDYDMMRQNNEPKIALFIDYDNIAIGLRESGNKPFEIGKVLERLLEKGRIIFKRAYADWYLFSEGKRPLHEHAIEMIDIPMRANIGKNSADIRLVVDALDLCYTKEHINTFVIGSGDSDFTPLVSKLKENDKEVIGFGLRHSTSNLLANSCDEFIFYEDLVSLAVSRPPLPPGLSKKQHDAFTILLDTIAALMRENKDVLWGSLIKDTIRRKSPSFNESQFGYSAFSQLLEDAAHHDLIGLVKDPKSGGTPVVTGFGEANESHSGDRSHAAPQHARGPSLTVPSKPVKAPSKTSEKPEEEKSAEKSGTKSSSRTTSKRKSSGRTTKSETRKTQPPSTEEVKETEKKAEPAKEEEEKKPRKTTTRRRTTSKKTTTTTSRKTAAEKADQEAGEVAEKVKEESPAPETEEEAKPKKPKRTTRKAAKPKKSDEGDKPDDKGEGDEPQAAAPAGEPTPPETGGGDGSSAGPETGSAPSEPASKGESEEEKPPRGTPLKTRIRRRRR